jgi:hypothetical protein
MDSVFKAAQLKTYPHRYSVQLLVNELHGGTPQNQDVALDHIRRQLADKGDLLRESVADLLADKAAAGEDITVDEAAAEIAMAKNLNGFRRDKSGLFIEGRHLKACLKEAVSIAVNSGNLKLKGWGETNKWATKWFPEHVFVEENRLHLGVADPDGIAQRFVVSRHGTGIQLEEYLDEATVTATIVADADLGDNWEAIWTTAEKNGLGASRSQGYGTFKVVKWDKVKVPGAKRAKAAVSDD